MRTNDLGWVAEVEADLHPSAWSEASFRDSLAAGHACWTFREREQPVAYAVLMMVLDEAHLLNITVERAQQGRGIGGAVLGFLFDEARRHGASQMFLEVRESNRTALALYRNVGFAPIGRRKGYYPGPLGREDAIVMRHAL